MSKDFGKTYSNLFNWRQEADYADFIEFDGESVKTLIKDVKEMNNRLKELISQ